jgi:hypothetical protein
MVKLVLAKCVGFARYRRFGVFGLHGHFDLILVFFRDLEVTYPPFSSVLLFFCYFFYYSEVLRNYFLLWRRARVYIGLIVGGGGGGGLGWAGV